MLKAFFEKEKIEYFSVCDHSRLSIINQRLAEREMFIPKSVIIYLVPYFTEQGINISSYAVSRDYHIFIKELNSRLIAFLKEKYPEAHFSGYGDHSPIDERLAAASAGLGIIGKNGLLINERYGSYVFIGEVLTDLPRSVFGMPRDSDILICEDCGLCLDACPTGALNGRGACLSDITQRKGELSLTEAELMKKCNTVWGCDICQRVCPHNASPEKTPIPFFYEESIVFLDEITISSMTDEEFERRAYSWRKRKTVERNIEKLK